MKKIVFYFVMLVLAMPGYASGVDSRTDVISTDTATIADYRQAKAELKQRKKELNRKIREMNNAKYKERHEVSLHWGAPPITTYLLGYAFTGNPYYISDSWKGDIFSDPLYQTQPINLGVFTAGYHYRFNGFFWLGATVSYGGVIQSVRSQDTHSVYYSSTFHYCRATVNCKFMYLNREYVQLYSSVGLGFTCWVKDEPVVYDGEVSIHRQAAALPFLPDVTAFGVSFGKDVYGMVEIGVGRSPLNIGLGYRF